MADRPKLGAVWQFKASTIASASLSDLLLTVQKNAVFPTITANSPGPKHGLDTTLGFLSDGIATSLRVCDVPVHRLSRLSRQRFEFCSRQHVISAEVAGP